MTILISLWTLLCALGAVFCAGFYVAIYREWRWQRRHRYPGWLHDERDSTNDDQET